MRRVDQGRSCILVLGGGAHSQPEYKQWAQPILNKAVEMGN